MLLSLSKNFLSVASVRSVCDLSVQGGIGIGRKESNFNSFHIPEEEGGMSETV